MDRIVAVRAVRHGRIARRSSGNDSRCDAERACAVACPVMGRRAKTPYTVPARNVALRRPTPHARFAAVRWTRGCGRARIRAITNITHPRTLANSGIEWNAQYIFFRSTATRRTAADAAQHEPLVSVQPHHDGRTAGVRARQPVDRRSAARIRTAQRRLAPRLCRHTEAGVDAAGRRRARQPGVRVGRHRDGAAHAPEARSRQRHRPARQPVAPQRRRAASSCSARANCWRRCASAAAATTSSSIHSTAPPC